MPPLRNNIANFLIKVLSTFFYLGYLPLAPGTFGSLAGILLFYLTKDNLFNYSLFTCALLILGFLVAGRQERILKTKDAKCIVIDEVGGMLLSLAFLPYDIKLVALGFLLFRILDTLKPYPASRIQDLKGSLGIMGDDIVAGLYTNIMLQALARLAS